MALYDTIERGIRVHAPFVQIPAGTASGQVWQALRQVLRDHPDIFWYAHRSTYDHDNHQLTLRYLFSYDRCVMLQKSIDDVVAHDFQIDKVRDLSTFRQVMYVYKWLLTYCSYNPNSAFNQEIDSVFVRRNSVCTGYAKAAQFLFDLLGIESRLVFGQLNNDARQGRHCWNLVKVDGNYFHLDVSLGDPCNASMLRAVGEERILSFGGLNYNFFCVSSLRIAHSRTIEDLDTLPECKVFVNQESVARLSQVSLGHRAGNQGCLLSSIGSSADIYLCAGNKRVVLKRFRATSTGQCDHEVRVMRLLKGCRHILQIDERYTDVNRNVLAIEQSTPLNDLLFSRDFKLSVQSLLRMVRDIATAWQECQSRGVIYRDLHLCNIFRSNDGTFKLGDFGSCTTDPMAIERVGNEWFMSPETYHHGVFNERSAIYSLSMVMYFILNGLQPAFWDVGTAEFAMEHRFKGAELPMPQLLRNFPIEKTLHLQIVVMRGTDYSALSRYDTMSDFIRAVEFAASRYTQPMFLTFNQTDFAFDNPLAQADAVDRIRKTAVPPSDVHSGCMVSSNHDETGCVDNTEALCSTMGLPDTYFAPIVTYDAYYPPQDFSATTAPSAHNAQDVYSSVFAPAEVKPKSHLLIQVYLHLLDEADKVQALAREAQADAQRRDYMPLQCQLKPGDRVVLSATIMGETTLYAENRTLVWRGSFTKCAFDFFVPAEIDVDELSCMVQVTINEAIIGEMRFITRIVDTPHKVHPQVMSRRYNKIFISYAHKDYERVRFIARAYQAQGVDYFFDRDYLRAGDVYPQVIRDYIDSADLFILCWSENAAHSDYVDKERRQALQRAYPNVRPIGMAQLTIYPLSIEPRAQLPADMKEIYNFEEI